MTHHLYPAAFIQACNPSEDHLAQLPSRHDIAKMNTDTSGIGIFALRPFKRGERIGKFLAEQTREIKQHTLQRAPGDQLLDPHFVGFLLHSCSPNVVLDMHEQEVFCIRDIPAGAPLTMDYASTEDVLFNQFACCCGSSNCREWVTGRAELVNADGLRYLSQRHDANLRHPATMGNAPQAIEAEQWVV